MNQTILYFAVSANLELSQISQTRYVTTTQHRGRIAVEIRNKTNRYSNKKYSMKILYKDTKDVTISADDMYL